MGVPCLLQHQLLAINCLQRRMLHYAAAPGTILTKSIGFWVLETLVGWQMDCAKPAASCWLQKH